MDTLNTLIRFIQEGGFFMYPIMMVLALGLAIAIERYIYLTKARITSLKMWQEVSPLLSNGEFGRVMKLAADSNSVIGKIISYGLARTATAKRREEVETAMEEGLMEVIPRLEKRTHYLATLANIATLLGLLGTIIGLIQAFTAVSTANPADKADLLSSSISVAMNTTAFGLVTAIPLLLIHALLQTKTTEIVDSLEMATVRLMNVITTVKPTAG